MQKNLVEMRKYAERIRTLQKELGLDQAKFLDLDLS